MDDPALKAVALYASATQNALVILTKCLLNNGALNVGQFSGALKETFNEPDADFQRLDYTFLQRLADMIDRAEAHDRK
jgi:hypothetical protein